MCNTDNVAYVDDRASKPNEEVLITIAHELGHLFGAKHVETPDCSCGGSNNSVLTEGNRINDYFCIAGSGGLYSMSGNVSKNCSRMRINKNESVS